MCFAGKKDIAVADSGSECRRGGKQVWIGPAAAAVKGPAAGLLVFLVRADLLALLGLGPKTGLVEAQAVAGAGGAQGGQTAAAGFIAGRPLPKERRGGAAGVLEGRVRSRGGSGILTV
jgi:hypothetical protein